MTKRDANRHAAARGIRLAVEGTLATGQSVLGYSPAGRSFDGGEHVRFLGCATRGERIDWNEIVEAIDSDDCDHTPCCDGCECGGQSYYDQTYGTAHAAR